MTDQPSQRPSDETPDDVPAQLAPDAATEAASGEASGLPRGPAGAAPPSHPGCAAEAPALRHRRPCLRRRSASQRAPRLELLRRPGVTVPAGSAGARGRRGVRRRLRPGPDPQASCPLSPPSATKASPTAVTDVSEKLSVLVREEIELAKTEVVDQGHQPRRGERPRRCRGCVRRVRAHLHPADDRLGPELGVQQHLDRLRHRHGASAGLTAFALRSPGASCEWGRRLRSWRSTRPRRSGRRVKPEGRRLDADDAVSRRRSATRSSATARSWARRRAAAGRGRSAHRLARPAAEPSSARR